MPKHVDALEGMGKDGPFHVMKAQREEMKKGKVQKLNQQTKQIW